MFVGTAGNSNEKYGYHDCYKASLGHCLPLSGSLDNYMAKANEGLDRSRRLPEFVVANATETLFFISGRYHSLSMKPFTGWKRIVSSLIGTPSFGGIVKNNYKHQSVTLLVLPH
jgi:hypothetical protein